MKTQTIKKQNQFIIFIVLSIALVVFATVFGAWSNTSAYAYPNSDSEFKKPTNLAELQAADPEDIAKLEKYDGRDYNLVTPVKNQASYNLCWCFAAVSAIESNILRKGYTTKGNLDLDELCLAYNSNPDDATWNTGGNPKYVGSLLSLWYGLSNEGTGPKRIEEGDSGYVMTKMVHFGSSVDSIKRAIAKYGAVTIDYHSSNYTYYCDDNYLENHCVSIVGWDDTVSRNKFEPKTPSRDGAWIVKNSWGETFGDGGYAYFSYELHYSNVTAFECERAEEYDHNYFHECRERGDNELQYCYYDETGTVLMRKAGNTYRAVTPNGNATQVLKAINLGLQYAGYMDTVCTIDIYTDVDVSAHDPTAGTLRSTTVYIAEEYTGYHTVILDEPITLEAGEYFSIVVTTNGTLLCDNGAVRDENFNSVYWDGSSWQQLEHYFYKDKIAAVRIKGWATYVEPNYDNLKTDLNGATIEFTENTFTYNGREHRPEFTVSLEGETLVPNVDYIVKYKDNLHTGTATVTVIGQGYYLGTAEKTFTIEKAQQPPNAPEAEIIVPAESIINVVLPVGWTYSNYFQIVSALDTEGSSTYATMNYTEDDASDYETVSLTVKLTRGAKGSKPITICTFSVADVYYSGSVRQPIVTVEDNGVALVEGMDYYVRSVSAVNAGDDYYVTVYGLGSYYHYKTVGFIIKKATADEPQDVTIAWDTDVKDINWGYGWTCKDSKVDIPAGGSKKVTLVYYDTDNYENAEIQVTVTRSLAPEIEINSIYDCNIKLDSVSFEYTGRVVKPKITVSHGDDTLRNGVDYVLLFENNVKGGTAKVTVKGIANYKDSAVRTFTINAPDDCYHEVYKKTLTPPSCTEYGYTTFTCENCGYSYTDEYVQNTGHTEATRVTTIEATCSRVGSRTITVYCLVCDTVISTNTTEIPQIAHDYSEVWSNHSTQHWHECTVCGDKKDIANHTTGEEPTETEPQLCTVCGYVIHVALGHIHSLTLITAKTATCTENGNIVYYVCSCGKLFSDSAATYEISHDATVILKSEHSYSDGVCTECGDKNSEQQTPMGKEHICSHVCEHCGKCLDHTCVDFKCAEKCQGHLDSNMNPSDNPQKPTNSLTIVIVVTVSVAIVAIVLTVAVCILLKRRNR